MTRTNKCPRCGNEIENENNAKHVGLKDGSVLFEDEMEYEELATICYGCRLELEEWLDGRKFKDVNIKVTVKG